MTSSNDGLAMNDLEQTVEAQRMALRSLVLAWENFADVKTVVEWTHRDNEGMRALMEGGESVQEAYPDEEARETEYRRLLTQNQVRLERLETLLNQEKSKALQQVQQTDMDVSDGEEGPIERVEQLYALAQEHRQSALDSLFRLESEGVTPEGALIELDAIKESVRQLRLLFFTVIEHLQDAAEQQEGLWQRTGAGAVKPYEEMIQEAPVWTMEQDLLKQRVEMISAELQSMADELATQGKNQESEALGDAFVETGLASGFMQDVVDGFSDVIADPSTSYDVSEMVLDQQQAYEALLRAIQALQPPQQGDQEDQQDQQDQENQNGEQNSDSRQQQQSGDMSQREAQRKMQAAKEKEAKRDQEQEEKAAVVGGFVEKDW